MLTDKLLSFLEKKVFTKEFTIIIAIVVLFYEFKEELHSLIAVLIPIVINSPEFLPTIKAGAGFFFTSLLTYYFKSRSSKKQDNNAFKSSKTDNQEVR